MEKIDMGKIQALLQDQGDNHIRPFLWMKGEDNRTIREELDRIEECGIREICLESRPHPDFCGPRWWESMDDILEQAQQRGMKVWILDDDKFPTGHANGAYIRQPDKSKVYLAERHMDICGPCRSNAVLVENFLPSDGKLLGILACPKPDGETLAVSAEGILDLTDQYHNGFVYFDLPRGPYRLFVIFTTHTGGGRDDYMNLIDSASVRVLIDEVYEKHYQHYASYFGSVIAGFFSDEPELGNVRGYPFDCSLGQKDTKLPWSARLEERLRAAWGESFLGSLPALWYECGNQTDRVRSTYMDQLTYLVKTCFSGQIREWCEEHHVEYIGHVIEDDNAHTRLGCSIGHYFREMEGQHMAGVDVVHHQIVPGFTEPVHQWIAGDRDGEFFHYGLAKLGSSAAHLDPSKKGRAFCEIFGNYGWAEGNSLMKWLTNHMLVRGINEFTPHAFAMTYPDRDCPPHFYARGNNPGFECFALLMKYMNRAAGFLSGGIPLTDAAILYHAESEWSGGNTMYFQKPGRELMEQGMDYDVIPADVLKDGRARVEAGRLQISQVSYPCLVLPYARCLDRDVADFILRNCGREASGEPGEGNRLKVFVIDSLPESDTEGKPLPEGLAEAVEIVGLKEIAQRVKGYEQVKAQFNDRMQLQVETPHSGLRTFISKEPDGLSAMFFNESLTESTDTFLRVWDGRYQAFTIYDPWSNTADTYACDGRIPLRLDPGETLFLSLKEGVESQRIYPVLESQERIMADWHVSRAGELDTGFHGEILLKAGEELPNLNGPGFDPSFTGTYRYQGAFSYWKQDGRGYKLLIPEASDCVKVWLNGQFCGYLTGFPSRISITDALRHGENEMTLEVITTLVWKRKDGASTHLQIPAVGITRDPVVEGYVTE